VREDYLKDELIWWQNRKFQGLVSALLRGPKKSGLVPAVFDLFA
jgi:hypothetical protein